MRALSRRALCGAGAALPVISPVLEPPPPAPSIAQLAPAFEAARRREAEAWAISEASETDAAWEAAAALNAVTGRVVDQMVGVAATSPAELLVKARALFWCRAGAPLDRDTLWAASLPQPPTDMRLLLEVLGDLQTMAGAA